MIYDELVRKDWAKRAHNGDRTLCFAHECGELNKVLLAEAEAKYDEQVKKARPDRSYNDRDKGKGKGQPKEQHPTLNKESLHKGALNDAAETWCRYNQKPQQQKARKELTGGKKAYAEMWLHLKREVLQELGFNVVRAAAHRVYFEGNAARPGPAQPR